MSNGSASQYKTAVLVFAAVVAIYGVFGWMDVGNYAQGGWNTDGNNTVTEVLPGSPSEAGGLQVGDKIVSLGGIYTTNAEAMAKRGRPEVGETWEFVVERDGATVSLDVTFGEPVPKRKFLAHAGFVVGFCFIIFTVRAYMQRQTDATMALALTGILFSFVFIAGPYFGNYTLRMVDNAVGAILVFLGVASLLNFLLVHLRSKSNKLVYLPGIAAGLFIAWRVLATPEATSGLNTFANIFIGAIAAFYLIGSLFTVYRAYSTASAAERDGKGLNLMLIGTLIGILPPAIAVVVGIFAPQFVLPGGAFYFLSFVALPVTWSMAVLRDGGAETAA